MGNTGHWMNKINSTASPEKNGPTIGSLCYIKSISPTGTKRTRPAVIISENQKGALECLTLYSSGAEKFQAISFDLVVSRSKASRLHSSNSESFWIPKSCVKKIIGHVAAPALELILRDKTKSTVKNYFDQVHKPKLEAPFTPGSSKISYAGRVYDERELLSLTDSTLDFWLTAGRFVESFEKRFAKKIGVRSASLVNSGSSANLVAFMALTSSKLRERKINKGDEVITVAAGFPTTVAPIIQYGARPVFVDITVDDGTYNIDCSQLEEAISSRSKAVMIAHTLGNPFNLDAVTDLCKKHGLWLIEDNCDALGSLYRGKLTGTFGDIATSSFYPPHHITMGEGGAVYTNNLALRTLIESFRDWGRDCWCGSGVDNTCGKRFNWQLGTLPEGYDHKYIYSHLGYNLKVTEMQAAVGCSQLDKVDEFISARRTNWAYLRNELADLAEFFVLPEPTKHSDPSWFGFLLTLKPDAPFKRKDIVRYLESLNIQTRMLFAGNFVRQPCFDELRADPNSFRIIGDLPNADRVMSDSFWLGVYPGLKKEMLDFKIEKLKAFCKDPLANTIADTGKRNKKL